MNRWGRLIGVLLAAWGIAIAAAGVVQGAEGGARTAHVGPRAQVYVDTSGSRSFAEIATAAFRDQFTANNAQHFGFGLSRNANWIRFRIVDVWPEAPIGGKELLLALTYASFGDIRVYLPMGGADPDAWTVLKGGIDHGPARDDTGFVFPLFKLPADVAPDRDVYVRIQGPFTSNFQMVLTDSARFEPLKLRTVLFLAFVFGVMGAMVFYNLILFVMLRNANYLWYVFYLIAMMTYQGTIIGVYKLISIPAADFLTAHVVLLCFLAMASYLMFSWSFLAVPRTAPGLKALYRVVWAGCLFGALFALGAKVYQANLLAYAGGVLLPFLLFATVAVSYRNGHWISRYYLLAVSVLLISVLIFALRGFGVIEHSIYTVYSVLVAAALESVLFSFALADRFGRLQRQHRTLQERERELSRISITDELTGLFNRRHFDDMLQHALEFAQGTGDSLCLVFMDIDHFKAINDRHGHPAGDEVLRVLGAIIRRRVRTSDFPCRIGGEEFAVLMLHTDVAGAGNVAERIRLSFGAQVFATSDGASFSATLSVGIADYRAGLMPDAFIKMADEALYRAKAAGRDCIVVAGGR